MNKPYLSALEISKEVPCNYARVLKAVQSGDLPCLMMGGNYMVQAADAEKYIQRARVTTDPDYVLELERQVKMLQERLASVGVRA